jgi:hypothetical protein
VLKALVRKRTASQSSAERAQIVLACAGVSRKITDDQVEVVTRVLTEKGPGQDTHWSTRAMAGILPTNCRLTTLAEFAAAARHAAARRSASIMWAHTARQLISIITVQTGPPRWPSPWPSCPRR